MKNIHNRRDFLKKSAYGTFAGIAGVGFLSGCTEKSEEEEEISPAEDLMREHGVLNRILLIYDHYKTQLGQNADLSLAPLLQSATIIRRFVEDYHEKLEEDFLFPRFEKAGNLTDLVSVLKDQHKAGRILTDQILNLSKAKTLTATDAKKLIQLLNGFVVMYRPHEAREDTVLFPALKKIVSSHEYSALGEDFEKKEHQLFGEDGFETMVNRVSEIEKQLNIYDLAKFTFGAQ
ncbi:hemerythrin domain-containing protein [Adhaeribacter soli]|uniref:Hemerythrin domain-containing protein n=1 Tax=Adhaeribacter soli TaxID=2607655 RepID=A0A5N1IHQ7_9BACT|nr:hemerythrin domain-containing protein [Adhaeribacter soli]KAA9325195.1 hemerythrin domain-containing protein [Adhaeribacter soli]